MKILLLLLFPFICFGQERPKKPTQDPAVIKEMALHAVLIKDDPLADTGYSAYGFITGQTKYVSFRDMLFHDHKLSVFMNSKIDKSVTVTITNSLEEVISQNYIKLKKGKNTFTPLSVFYPGEYIIKVKE